MSKRKAKRKVAGSGSHDTGTPSSTGAATRISERRARTRVTRQRRERAASWDRVMLTLRSGASRLLRSAPTAAWICALVACLNAVSWSLITPPFQAPDEPAHFAYVEQLARSGHLPTSTVPLFPSDETLALGDLETLSVSLKPQNHTIAARSEQVKLERDLAAAVKTSPPATGAAGVAASQPPLYYALQVIPYGVGAGGGVLDQLQLMRLLSALMAGVTALFAFLFLRETLPATPRAWTVGGLGVAFFPALGFISGAVNPDSMLIAVSAAVFYCLARAFRRVLTLRLAMAIGALTAVGLLTKLNFLGLVPGIVLGLVLLTRIASQTLGGRAAYRALGAALVIAAGPALVYVLINVLSHHRTLGQAGNVLSALVNRHSFSGELSYIWQLYLPRLPGMHVDFADISPIRDLWFNGLVGFYGWEDTTFPRWVDTVALIPALGILALSAREVFLHRPALPRRVGELAVYFVMAVGLMVLIGAVSYLSYPVEAAGFPEPRYLLPLIPLFGLVLALATRGAGRRWGTAAGALIVVLFVAHDLFSQLQVIGRYYG